MTPAVGQGTGLVFVSALPVGGRTHGITVARAAELRSKPGEWARWPTKTSPAVLRKTLNSCDRAGGTFEAETRDHATYARWVGPALAAGPGPVASPPPAHRVERLGRPALTARLAPAPTRAPVAPERPPAPPEATTGPGGETVTVDDDDGENPRPATGDELAAFRPLVPATPPPPVSADAWHPKIKCSSCKTYLVIADGTTGEAVLRDHLRDPANRACAAYSGSTRIAKAAKKTKTPQTGARL